MVLPEFRIEAKSTKKISFRIRLPWLRKIQDESSSQGENPALSITFTDARGNPVDGGRWVLITESMFQEFLERAK